MATAQPMLRQLLAALPDPPHPVVLELRALTFCDLHGLDALREFARAAQVDGVALTVRGRSRQLERLERAVPPEASAGLPCAAAAHPRAGTAEQRWTVWSPS